MNERLQRFSAKSSVNTLIYKSAECRLLPQRTHLTVSYITAVQRYQKQSPSTSSSTHCLAVSVQHSWDLCLNRQPCGLLFCLCAMSYQMSFTAKYVPHKDRKLSSSCCACVTVVSRGPQGCTHSARMTRLLCTRKCRSPPARTVTVWIM